MATVVSLVEAKIQELMSGWEGVALSQDQLNALIIQIKTDLATQGASLENFNEVVLPELEADLSANSIALADLVTTSLPALQADLDANASAILTLNEGTLPLLTDRVATNEDWIADLNGTVLPGLGDQLAELEGKFPITGPDIAADAIEANHILAHTITALQIAADTITANEIAADTITANEIAADTITANEIAADTITASEIAADTITANEIAADAITATELAAGSVTAVKIEAATITGDKIAANTIGVTKLIVSDLTNYVVDGDVSDATLSAWDRGLADAELSRTDPVGETPYLEVLTSTTKGVFFHNKHLFELYPGDEFYYSMEVSTPASNTENLTFSPAVEVYDVDGTSMLWRGPAEALDPFVPNTPWTAINGTIRVTDTNVARARFNAYVLQTTTAGQKFRVRKIQFRKRNAGELVVDGTITAAKLDVDSVTTSVINTGAIQSQLAITGLLEIAGADMGWSAAEGLYLGEDVRLYGDSRTNYLEGDLVTSSISIRDGLSLGGNGDINGIVTLSNGIATPSAKMLLSQTWPRSVSNGFANDNKDESGIYQSLVSYDSTRWAVQYNYFGAGVRLLNKSDLSFVGDMTLGSWRDTYYPNGGGVLLGGSFYWIGSDSSRNGNYYIYKTTSTGTLAKQAEVYVTSLNGFGGKRVRLVTDGTNIGMIWCSASSSVMILRWYNAALSATVGSDISLLTGMGSVNVGGAYIGPTYSGGPNRLIVSLYSGDSNMIRSWSLTGSTAATRQAAEDWPRASDSTVIAINYDSTGGRMLSMDKSCAFYTYSKYRDGGILNAQYTEYDGDNSVYPSGTIINGVDRSGQVSGFHETAPSPVTSFALGKRAWPVVTSPPATDELVTDVTQVDKANRLGIYAAIGATPRLQGGDYLAVGVRTLPVTDEFSTTSTLAGASTVPSFSTASVPAPGRFRSGALDGSSLPLIDLYGSGDGRAGPLRWASNGTPLNYGVWQNNTTQTITNNVWTTRTGWTVRNSTSAPGHGVTHSAGSFTVSQSGLYLISTGITLVGSATAGTRVVGIFVNGTNVVRSEAPSAAVAQITTPCATTAMYLAAGDVVTSRIWHPISPSLATTTDPAQHWMSMVCLAAY